MRKNQAVNPVCRSLSFLICRNCNHYDHNRYNGCLNGAWGIYKYEVPEEKRMAEMKKTDNEAIGKAYASKAAAYYGLKQDLQKIIR